MKRFIMAAAFAFAACTHPIPNPPPPDSWDASSPATCETVCAHWAALHCAEGAVPERCLGACSTVVSHPEIVRWNLGCRANVSSCKQIDKCEAP
jgi:hypothetical protein